MGPFGPWILAAVTFSVSGCQTIGDRGFGPSTGFSPGTEGSRGEVYQGVLAMEGGDLPAALEIVRRGRRDVFGALQTSSGLTADGEGRLRGQTLTLELVYGGDCPGRMILEGDWDRGAGTYEGVLEARDCTGNAQGTFRFSVE